MTQPAILLKHPSGVYVCVKQGFSWPAFVLGSLWAIVRHMWRLAAVLIVVDVLLWFVGGYALQKANPALLFFFLIANIVYAVVRGRYGNRWLLAALYPGGFVSAVAQSEPAFSANP